MLRQRHYTRTKDEACLGKFTQMTALLLKDPLEPMTAFLCMRDRLFKNNVTLSPCYEKGIQLRSGFITVTTLTDTYQKGCKQP